MKTNLMPPSVSPHSTSHHWFRRLLVVNLLVALVLGTWGYKEYHHETRRVDALYNSARQFAMHSPHLENEVPWQLSLFRWLAAVTSLGALFGLGKFMWREALAQRRIRVFISSTFRDMIGGRIASMSHAWSELRRLCRERYIEPVEVDLRRGVAEAQSSRKETLKPCLDGIRSCRPFFIGLLALCLAGCSRREESEVAGSDAGRFSFGKVIAATKTNLRIKEYDFAKDADMEASYVVTPQTEYGNVANPTDLQPGDDVVIDYIEKGDQRMVTTLVREEHGDDTGPCPGRLVIAPDFQQIGDTEDGGGIFRAMAGTMSLLGTDEVEQDRLARLAQQPTPLANPPPVAPDLSGIKEWIASTGDLPDAVHLRQWSAFAPWKFMMWGDGFGDCTVALYLANELQFAWQGYGMATTGPLLPETPGEDPVIRFAGPPAGTDLDGDGVPDILIYDYSGGAHCCSTVKHIVCSDPPVLTAQISGWHSTPSYRDLDGDGRYEMIVGDASYAYWNACYAASPQPRVIFRIRHGHYEMAGDLMRSNAPAADGIAADIKEFQHRLSRYDLMESRTSQPEGVKPTEEEQADEDFFLGQTWHPDDMGIRIPPLVWDLLLNLIYSGQIDAAVNALDTMWPPGKAHKAEFANDLLAMIRSSWHGSHLPWFNELERAFARSFPLSTTGMAQYPADGGTVADGKKVWLDYTLTVDGKLVGSTFGDSPLVYMHGENQLIPGLEQALTGMKTGEAKQVIVKPEEGYGPSDPELFREIEKTKLPAGQTLVKGMEVEVNLEGTPLPGTVFEVKARTVVMDFNHPLAGKTLVYDVKIAAVGQTPATNDATEPPPEKRR